MYKIKQLNEDFIVREKYNLPILPDGPYQYFLMEKRGMNTLDAISLLSRSLNLPKKNFGYAGNKDKRAVTSQAISIFTNKKIEDVNSERISIKFLGKGKEKINLGSHIGNSFEIVVRNIDFEDEDLEMPSFIPNYFDTQRFSTQNIEIGLKLLKKDFEGALNDLIASNYDSNASVQDASESLENSPKNFIGALRLIDKKLLSIYINSVQSIIFNKLLSEHIKNATKAYKIVKYPFGELIFPFEMDENLELPLVGFGTDIDDVQLSEALELQMGEMGITTRSFVIKEYPEISSEGRMRSAFANVTDASISKLEDDEHNMGTKKCTAKFSLPNGSYATIVIRSLFG